MMPTGSTWIMDEATRNKFLKNYKTQVASATSTICATLAVVRLRPDHMFEWREANWLPLDSSRKCENSHADVSA